MDAVLESARVATGEFAAVYALGSETSSVSGTFRACRRLVPLVDCGA